MAVNKNKNFFQKMFANGTTDTVSSKRVTMFLGMIMLIGLAIASALGYNCDTSYVYVFASLVGAQSGLSTIEKCAKGVSQAKVDVAKAEYSDNTRKPAFDDDDEDEHINPELLKGNGPL